MAATLGGLRYVIVRMDPGVPMGGETETKLPQMDEAIEEVMVHFGLTFGQVEPT